MPATEADESPVTTSGCPIDHRALTAATAGSGGGVCPFPMGAGQRSPADMVVRKLLRIRDRPTGLSENAAYSAFQRSMLISAIRCTLTYVIFPFVLPAAGFATGVGPVLGIAIGLVAITCDVFTIRRFFSVDHRWRWHFSAIAGTVICLLLVLMVQDIVHLLR
ncbi:MAG: hypothetical protein ABI658_20380 [Acidimicrobiales bacterium]